MKALSSTLSLAVLSALCIGCSASRQQIVLRLENPVSFELVRSDDRPAERMTSPEVPVIGPSLAPTAVVTSAQGIEETATITAAMIDTEIDIPELQQVSSDERIALAADLFLPIPTETEVKAEDVAEETPEPLAVQGMTLHALEELALQNNPSIQQVSATAAKASAVRTQVGLRPNPTIGYFGQEIGNEGAGGQHGAFISQTFVRGDKLAWNRQVIGHDVNSLMWQVETQRQRVRTDIQVQFYTALAAQNRLRLARDFRSIAEKGVTISEARVKAQFGTRPDVLQSQIQLSEVDLSIQRAEFEFEAAWKMMVAVAGVPNLEPTTLIGELTTSVDERDMETAYAEIVAESPLMAAAIAQVDRTRANVQRQNAQPISNVTAQFGVGTDNSTGDGYANIQLSMPLPYHNKNQGSIRAAHAAYCEATQNVQRLRMQIRSNLAEVMREYQIAQATVRQYETAILPKAKETMELMQEAQAAGQFDFLRVLTARRAYFDVNLKYVTALGSLAQSNAKIEGLLLTGGLSNNTTYNFSSGLRGQALSGQ